MEIKVGSVVLGLGFAQIQRRPAMNTSRVIFAMIILRKITDLQQILQATILVLGFATAL
jgi:hypothetical protein